jgi:hypothetical protein
MHDEVAAVYQRDPRTLDPGELKRLCREASARVAALGPEIAFNAVAALSELREELFISSEGSLISQGFAFSQGDCYIVAQSGDGHQEIYDTIGQQRGLECLAEGYRDELMPNPDLLTFALELAAEARELAAAPVLKPLDAEDFTTSGASFTPTRLDLARPCPTIDPAWGPLGLRSLEDNEVGRQVGSPPPSACPTPPSPATPLSLRPRDARAGAVMRRKGVFRLSTARDGRRARRRAQRIARASEVFTSPSSGCRTLPDARESDPQQIIADVERG